jgi:hypothetical protein
MKYLLILNYYLCYNNYNKTQINIYGGIDSTMSQYLSKEEIKQWRSSLEKITLEEYAKKLGKVLEEDKQTSDIIDMVMKNEKRLYSSRDNADSKQQIIKLAKKSQKIQDDIMQDDNQLLANIKSKLTCKKPLTEREDKVLIHFAKNQGEIVYAKDLAMILSLPSDYVYKYIKNLRTKITQDILQNADKGGYIFKI